RLAGTLQGTPEGVGEDDPRDDLSAGHALDGRDRVAVAVRPEVEAPVAAAAHRVGLDGLDEGDQILDGPGVPVPAVNGVGSIVPGAPGGAGGTPPLAARRGAAPLDLARPLVPLVERARGGVVAALRPLV